MNNKDLIRIGLRQRAIKALVDGNEHKAYTLLQWARQLR